MQSVRVFRDGRPSAIAAVIALAAGVVLDAYGAFIVQPDALLPPPGWQQLHYLVRLATVVTFLMWFDRVYGNLEALDVQPEHWRGWAVVSFFVPPFCFFRPPMLLIEVGSGGQESTRVSSGIVVTWWLLFLGAPAALLTLSRTDPGAPMRVIIAHALNVAAGTAAIYLVQMITRHQAATFTALLRAEQAEERRRQLAAKQAALLAATPLGTSAPATPAPVTPGPLPAPASLPSPARDAGATRVTPGPAAFGSQRRSAAPAAPSLFARLDLERQFAQLRRFVRLLRPGFWVGVSAWVAILVAIALLLGGSRQLTSLTFESIAAGATQIVFGATLIASWLILRRTPPAGTTREEGRRWRVLAAVVLIVAALNLLALAGTFRP